MNQYVDLERLQAEAGEGIGYTRRSDSRVNLRFGDEPPVVTIHRTGKYSIRNATSDEELEATDERVLDFLSRAEGEDISTKRPLSVDNRIWVAEFDRDIDLEGLADELGENAVLPERPDAALVARFPERETVAFVTRAGTLTVSGDAELEGVQRTVGVIRSALE